MINYIFQFSNNYSNYWIYLFKISEYISRKIEYHIHMFSLKSSNNTGLSWTLQCRWQVMSTLGPSCQSIESEILRSHIIPDPKSHRDYSSNSVVLLTCNLYVLIVRTKVTNLLLHPQQVWHSRNHHYQTPTHLVAESNGKYAFTWKIMSWEQGDEGQKKRMRRWQCWRLLLPESMGFWIDLGLSLSIQSMGIQPFWMTSIPLKTSASASFFSVKGLVSSTHLSYLYSAGNIGFVSMDSNTWRKQHIGNQTTNICEAF